MLGQHFKTGHQGICLAAGANVGVVSLTAWFSLNVNVPGQVIGIGNIGSSVVPGVIIQDFCCLGFDLGG